MSATTYCTNCRHPIAVMSDWALRLIGGELKIVHRWCR